MNTEFGKIPEEVTTVDVEKTPTEKDQRDGKMTWHHRPLDLFPRGSKSPRSGQGLFRRNSILALSLPW